MRIKSKSKPKIAYIVTPITFGGAEKVNLNFLKNVDRNRFNIHPILIIRPWEDETIVERELINSNYTYSKVPVALNAKEYFFCYLRCFFKIMSVVKHESIDLMHTHGYLADIIGYIVSKSLQLPIISTCHGLF